MLFNIFSKGDLFIQIIATILFFASIITWMLIGYKIYVLLNIQKITTRTPVAFWSSKSLKDSILNLRKLDHIGIFENLFVDAIRSLKENNTSSHMPVSDRLDRILRISLNATQQKLDMGMTMLATITSSAPFIGLLGTVWGIYSTLLTLGTQNNATLLDKVSGPIGESLIMTAIGLAVAIPSLIAYNLFAKWIRQLKQSIDGFAIDLHAYVINNTDVLSVVEIE